MRLAGGLVRVLLEEPDLRWIVLESPPRTGSELRARFEWRLRSPPLELLCSFQFSRLNVKLRQMYDAAMRLFGGRSSAHA